MAGRSMARSKPQDENFLNPLLSARKSGEGGTIGKGQTQERRKLSNITNRLQPPLSQAPAARGGSAASFPLKPKKSVPLALNPKAREGREKQQPTQFSEEVEKKAERWAEEGAEVVHFTGRDMELLGQKMQQEELQKRIDVAMAYRTNFPSFLPCASEKVVEEIDVLKMDSDEKVYVRECPKFFLEVEPLDPNDMFEDIPLETIFDRKDTPLIAPNWQTVHDDSICNIQRTDHDDASCLAQSGLHQVDSSLLD